MKKQQDGFFFFSPTSSEKYQKFAFKKNIYFSLRQTFSDKQKILFFGRSGELLILRDGQKKDPCDLFHEMLAGKFFRSASSTPPIFLTDFPKIAFISFTMLELVFRHDFNVRGHLATGEKAPGIYAFDTVTFYENDSRMRWCALSLPFAT